MVFKKSFFILFIIIILATIIRLFFVFNIPSQIDELIMADLIKTVSLGNIPVHFSSVNGENITIIYLAVPFYRIFNTQTVLIFRFIALVFNSGFIILTFLLLKNFFSEKLALVAAALLAIWPWSIKAGSIGYNAYLLLFLYSAGLYLFFLAMKKGRLVFYFSAVFFWAISFYTYSLSFVWVPLFLLIIFIIYRRDINLKHFIYSLIFLLILIIPISLFFLKNQFHLVTLNYFLFFNIPDLAISRFDTISIFTLYDGVWIALNYFFNYFLHFALLFLSYNPTSDSFWFYLVYLWDVPLIFLGLFVCLKNFKQNKFYQLLVIWFFTYPLASSFINAEGGFSSTRDIHSLPLLAILSAIGILIFWDSLKKLYLIKLSGNKTSS
ncbi:MAG: hypothetical protein A2731_00455 [Candidatus Buchananbacteria bacterium RIFCSPHIGHO2_01_FULL_39_8]|uniref:Glycosyltransferase RgtA/B/C/D-like domain-containing protein n=1 Tax=Candidatus Buchananbacteria bacterium RIFCSPHIGHO2_01_FULL_39_8 TaxID=1797533 RepID=A0A1G1XTB0_9BACT|nr:MAG: hypothetical protein A2731_00455 [Candidatus Buchananbacteria bacterium RIFCSPHIGHO2_01_FULL_39_8]